MDMHVEALWNQITTFGILKNVAFPGESIYDNHGKVVF